MSRGTFRGCHDHSFFFQAEDGIRDDALLIVQKHNFEGYIGQTNAEAQRTTVTSAATHACKVSLPPTLSDVPSLKTALLASYRLPGGRDRSHGRSATPDAPVRCVLPYP